MKNISKSGNRGLKISAEQLKSHKYKLNTKILYTI